VLAEASANYALKLAVEFQFPYFAALSRCILGHARRQLGCMNEGIGLIRQGIAGLIEINSRWGVSRHNLYLAVAQEKMERSPMRLRRLKMRLRSYPKELFYRPEALRLLSLATRPILTR